MKDPFDLHGRTALVTGGAGLLGVQHAAALAASGAQVVIADVDGEAAAAAAARVNDEAGAELASGTVMDVTRKEDIEAVHARLESGGRPCDILVNNAAINPKVKEGAGLKEFSRFENFEIADWNLEVRVGLTGAFLCSQVFGSAMAGRGRGVILNIASDLSVIAPDQRLYHRDGVPDDQQPVKPVTYSVIKTGLLGLTRYLAAYWADRGVRVNAISPGGVYTNQPDSFVKKLTDLIPMGRMAEAGEYRATIQYLCSDASRYMTGQNIVLDGGRSII